MKLAFIRHGPTEWNEAGRIHGRADIGLSAAGRAKMAALAPPSGFSAARVFVSDRARTQETARLMGLADFTIDARLGEHDWGQWEGLTLDEIRAQDGQDAFARAGLAFDFHPPGGETTRALMARVGDFIADMAKGSCDVLAITHLGVMRTAYALATSWDMGAPLPEGVDFSVAIILALDGAGRPRLEAINVALSPKN